MKKILALISFFIILSPKTISAASFDLSVAPAIFQIELTPPAVAKAEKTLLLENTGDEPLIMDVLFKPFLASEKENGEVVFQDKITGANPNILEKISIIDDGKKITTVTLSPKQKKELDFVVTVDEKEPPSDYYFTILFLNRQAENSTIESSASLSQGGIGVNVLLSVGPKKPTIGSIEEFSAPFFMTSGPVPFTVRINNMSGHFIYPKGHILIKNMFGQTIGKVDLLPVNILSNSTRSLPSGEQFIYAANENSEKDKQIEKIQQLTRKENQPIAVWPESFLLGPYTATLTIALSPEGPLYTRDIHFIGFPFQLIIGVAIIVMIILIVRARLKQRDL